MWNLRPHSLRSLAAAAIVLFLLVVIGALSPGHAAAGLIVLAAVALLDRAPDPDACSTNFMLDRLIARGREPH